MTDYSLMREKERKKLLIQSAECLVIKIHVAAASCPRIPKVLFVFIKNVARSSVIDCGKQENPKPSEAKQKLNERGSL